MADEQYERAVRTLIEVFYQFGMRVGPDDLINIGAIPEQDALDIAAEIRGRGYQIDLRFFTESRWPTRVVTFASLASGLSGKDDTKGND